MNKRSAARPNVPSSIAAVRDLEEADTDDRQLSRRKIFKSAVGVAAAGAAGASVLAKASPASAATTTEQGALAPAVVNLTDAATIAVDASLGNDFRVTIAASRTMGNPTNPTDGQKVVFEIIQGSGGSNTITWGSAYEFSSSLPQPTLSTAASQADLLGFVYNGDIGKWLLATYVNGFTATTVASPSPSTSPSTSPSPSPSTSSAGTYRLFPATNGPSSPVAYSGPFMAGILFKVTTGGCWLGGYWWWVCPSGQAATAQKFALWCVYNTGVGTLVPAATVTSGPLTPGAWNYVPLATPVPLAIGACYNVCTGFSGSFPDNQSQFGAGEPYKAGIVNGPLSAFSDQSGTLPAPFSMSQGVFSVGGSDPTALMPSNGNQSDNLWMDLQVTTSAPTGTSYRLWPNYPRLPNSASAGPYTLATEFTLSQSCTVKDIWFYSAPGATALPTRCAIWNVSTKSVVSGTDNTSPTWSGAAGSCWVSCSYSGVSLPAGDYKVAVFYGGSADWFLFTTGYWAGGGPGASGITSGPLTAPSNSQAASPGQATYNGGTWAYPQTYGTEGNGENYWVDVEVTPS